MGIFRVEKVKDYTTISNYHLRDKRLSLKAKGLLTMILALPEDWNFTIRGLSAICKEGVESIGTALKELEKSGYLVRKRVRGADGRMNDTEYNFYEEPIRQTEEQPEESDDGQSGTEEPEMKTSEAEQPHSKATNKQFITVQTRKGETYYIVIDYDKPLDKDGEQYETYFLNLVDDRDLFGVVSKDEQPTPEPTATPTPKPTAEPKPEAERTTDSTAMMALVLLVVLIAGGAAAFVVLGKKRDAQPRYNTELDDDDDEEEIGEENEEK